MGLAKSLYKLHVRRQTILPGYPDEPQHGSPPDVTSRPVVEYREPVEGVAGPGSVKILGRGWWPADRVVADAASRRDGE